MDWLSYFGRMRRPAQLAYRRQIASMFGQAVRSPFDDLRQGLVLGGDALWEQAMGLIDGSGSGGDDEIRRRRRADRDAARQWVEAQAAAADDRRIELWLLARLGGERLIALAERYGYADPSGVHRVVQRLEQSAAADKSLARRLAAYRRKLSKVKH